MLLQAPAALDLTLCDREPIHIPGSIQPHGLLLVADPRTGLVQAVAGDVEGRLTPEWRGVPLTDLIGQSLDTSALSAGDVAVLEPLIGQKETFDVSAHLSGEHVLVELEPAEAAGERPLAMLAMLEAASHRFERTIGLSDLYREAAEVFRELTGYDRVMVYRFLEDEAGVVVGESDADGVGSFMNHHFPAGDIPRQARDLYVRNRIRVIPDVGYEPAPLRAGDASLPPLDLSDASLRSVSPIHIQYLRNMEVAASASVSIVQDGVLWGLIACHNRTPRHLTLGTRVAARTLASGLSRQIRAKDEAVLYRERIRLRASEDAACARLGRDTTLAEFFRDAGADLRKMLGADGFAAIQGGDLFTNGRCPDDDAILELGSFARRSVPHTPVATDRLSEELAEAGRYRSLASGLLSVVMSTEVPTLLLWFRAEKLEVVNWAGNPHKNVAADPTAVLTPRSSFEDWTETVRGRSKPWSLAEIESADRLVRRLREERATQRLRVLNEELALTIRENEALIGQKDFLLKEVNHRVQNSLQLVMTFLRMQALEASGSEAVTHLAEAQRRIGAVSLVHRRLYTGASVEVVDLGRYLEELVEDLVSSMEEGWRERIHFDLVPVLISADRAVPVGLIVTELVINASKYAYEGQPGPLAIALEQHHDRFRLIVADRGAGKGSTVKGTGFGSRMLQAVVSQIGGTLETHDNRPGLRTVVSAPVKMVWS
ncbi:histidine kinase dimerization/phosphoacceptor domain -containing protein [Aureimonas jatrophae]|uniref:Bacteriophytochrome (Light-regulated signal transduction histidine kinase) n=1 Tax=Aureimonas jatrophae TaxID=1166073 RepID=A0A1H0DEH6_9HYPH|nr:histidine kinase dimerization/phosphoacceptor domain -containing protein [Aureimonas jatrophae]MBB3951842.1 light-regulated signal transduction histidine kinase (bacteriophytochrome) [Aureimonas jatrophae]SDN68371.1 Bacteriophytochrome (light-regulated signal transduction histidine kinase) [Aureimonas jatrophae]